MGAGSKLVRCGSLVRHVWMEDVVRVGFDTVKKRRLLLVLAKRKIRVQG